MKKINIILISIITLMVFSLVNCSKNNTTQTKNIAKVNNYNITLEDFEDQRKKSNALLQTLTKEKQNDYVLDLLINEVLLLEEAEKTKINQNKNFLKTIEHFWRQSLIQELLKIQTDKISKKISITNDDIKKYYNALKTQYYLRYIDFSKDLSLNLTNINKLDSFLETNNSFIQIDSKWIWTDIREINNKYTKYLLKDIIFNKPIWIKNTDKYSCLIIKSSKQNTIPEFKKIKSEIHTILKEQKEQKLFIDWMNDLKNNAKIVINKDKL